MFRNKENERLEKALLMAFDPYTNKEIMELLKGQAQVDMLSLEQVKEYYKFPAKKQWLHNDETTGKYLN